MELSWKEYSLLYYICKGHRAYRSLLRFRGKDLILDNLEKKELIELIYADKQLSAVVETKKVREIVEDSKYVDWYKEFEA